MLHIIQMISSPLQGWNGALGMMNRLVLALAFEIFEALGTDAMCGLRDSQAALGLL